MRRIHRIVLLAGLVALAPVLAGCEDFDMDKFDFFDLNDKKKLPGERKELFPKGVPGVTQGIPPEYLKGNQPPPDTAQAPRPDATAAATAPDGKPAAAAPSAKTAAIEPAAEPKPKAKPKRKPQTAARPAKQDTGQPAAQGQSNGPQQLEPWPGTAPQQPASGQSVTAPWPSAPPPATGSR